MTARLSVFLWIASAAAQSVQVQNFAAPSAGVAPGTIIDVYNFEEGVPNSPNPSRVTLQFQPRGSTQVYTAQALATFPGGLVRGIVPYDVPVGVADFKMIIAGFSYPPVAVTMQRSALGLFTSSGFGFGPALAQNDGAGPPSLNQLTNPARPGQYVTLWGTGLGNVTTADVAVEVAGKLIPSSFAGHAPGLPGVDQINFVLPADAPTGCYVPLTVHAAGSESNGVTIATSASGEPCSHPLGLTADQLRTLDQGGAVAAGSVTMGSGTDQGTGDPFSGFIRSDFFQAAFWQRDAFEMFLLAGTQTTAAPSSCVVLNLGVEAFSAGIFSFLPGSAAGSVLTLTGPAGQRADITSPFAGEYLWTRQSGPLSSLSALPASFFSAGAWQIAAGGDGVIGPFQHSFSLPPPLHWINRTSLATFSRDSDATVLWDPAGYSATDVVALRLLVGSPGFVAVQCLTPAQAGQTVLPKALLQQLTPDPAASLYLFLTPGTQKYFTVPAAGGGSLPALFGYQFSEAAVVAVR